MNSAAPFKSVIAEAAQSALLSQTDVDILCQLVDVLGRPIVDIRKELEEQPKYRAAAGYYFRHFGRVAKNTEREVEESWLRHYNTIHAAKYGGGGKSPIVKKTKEDTLGRFSEKLVTALACQDPAYSDLVRRASQYAYLSDQLYELREAFSSRSRFLEQLAYSQRHGE